MYRLFLVVVIVTIFSDVFCNAIFAQEIEGVKCVVEGDRNARQQFKAKHANGEVYFCCQGCAAAFVADPSAHQTRANHQLVVTQQYSQTACPIAGKNFDVELTTKVAGVEVAFCCGNCKASVEAASDLPAKAELVFGPAAFKRAFSKSQAARPEVDLTKDLTKVKCLVDPKRMVKEKFVADHRGGKIYFCCGGCLKAFQADPAKFSAQANLQLVATKQYTQTACPLTDGDVDTSKTVAIAGQEIGFCCGGCLAKVEAATVQERVAMVFDDAAFEKSFSQVTKTESIDNSVAPDELAAPGQ